MGRLRAFAALCLLLAFGVVAGLFVASRASGASASSPPTPTLDTSFGTNGFTSIPYPVPTGAGYTDPQQSQVDASAVDASGRILLAGTALAKDSSHYTVGEFCVARLSPAGTLDTNFGTSGVACLSPLADAYGYPESVAVDPATGDIVVAGTLSSNTTFVSTAYVVRFDSSGAPDASFGTGGVLTGPTVSASTPSGAVVQSTGKIVLAYVTTGGVLTLARYDGGTPDTSYGNSGTVALSIASPYYNQLLALQPDDSIDVGGAQSGHLALQHVTAGGAVDSSFGTAGVATVPGVTSGYPYAIALEGSKILLSGSNYTGSAYDAIAARFTSAGAPDATFGTGGVLTVTPPSGTSNIYGGPIFYDSDPGVVEVDATDSDLRVCTSDDSGGGSSCPLTVQGNVKESVGWCTAEGCELLEAGSDSNDHAVVGGISLMTTSSTTSGTTSTTGTTGTTATTTSTTTPTTTAPLADLSITAEMFTFENDYPISKDSQGIVGIPDGYRTAHDIGGYYDPGHVPNPLIQVTNNGPDASPGGTLTLTFVGFGGHDPQPHEDHLCNPKLAQDATSCAIVPQLPGGSDRVEFNLFYAPGAPNHGTIGVGQYSIFASVVGGVNDPTSPDRDSLTYVIYPQQNPKQKPIPPKQPASKLDAFRGLTVLLPDNTGRLGHALLDSIDARGVAKRVEVALLHSGGKSCSWLSGPKATFKSVPARGGKCLPSVWLNATGTKSWTYRLKSQLPAGRYTLYSRIIDASGLPSVTFSPKLGDEQSFTLK